MAQGKWKVCGLSDWVPARDRVAVIEFKDHVNSANQWFWRVAWPGWFQDSGYAVDKQGAADATAAAWWRMVITPIPRDIETEIAVILGRSRVCRPDSSWEPRLLSADSPMKPVLKLGNAILGEWRDASRRPAMPVSERQVRQRRNSLSRLAHLRITQRLAIGEGSAWAITIANTLAGLGHEVTGGCLYGRKLWLAGTERAGGKCRCA